LAKTRIYEWTREALSFQKLNAEFDALLTNPMDLISPATAELKMDGQKLVLDVNRNTSVTADSDDVIHFECGGFDSFIMDGDVASPVNGLTFVSAATGTPAVILPHGEAGCSLKIEFADDLDSSLRETADDIVALELQGFDAFIFDGDVGTPVLGLTFTSAAEAGSVGITVQGSGTDGDLTLTSKGAGVIDLIPGSTGTVNIDGEVLAGTVLNATATSWAPGSIAAGESASTTVAVTGAVFGDFCLVSASESINSGGNQQLTAHVLSSGNVQVTLANHHTGAIDLGTIATIYVRVLQLA
jgi:hypothetical protein